MSDLSDRFHNVRLLLETLNDPYPTPHGALVTESGPAASFYVPCETCRRAGEVRVRGGWMLCLCCDGRGWRRRERGDRAWDAYVNLPVEEAAELPRPSAARRLLAPLELEESYAWERALAAHDRHGSYASVRRALDWLSTAHPRRYRLVRAITVEHEVRVVSRAVHRELELGILMIVRRVGTVRVPPWLVEKSSRRETVETLTAAGFTPGEVARTLGLSKRAVQRKIRQAKRSKIGPAGVPLAGT